MAARGPYFAVALGYHRHPKALRAGLHGRAFHLAALDYARSYETDGFIPDEAVPAVQLDAGCDATGVERAVAAGLMERVDGGLAIHGYGDWQQTAAEVEDLRSKRSAAGRKGNETRWSHRPHVANAIAPATPTAIANASQTDRIEVQVREVDTATTSPSRAPARKPSGVMANPAVAAWLEAAKAAGFTPSPSALGEVDATSHELLAAGAAQADVIEAARRAGAKGFSHRLDMNLRNVEREHGAGALRDEKLPSVADVFAAKGIAS